MSSFSAIEVLWWKKLRNVGHRKLTLLSQGFWLPSPALLLSCCVTLSKSLSSLGLSLVTCEKGSWPWPHPELTTLDSDLG